MKIEYDPKHDILNIEFIANADIVDSYEFDGIIVDYTNERKIAAVEILDAGDRTEKNPLDLLNLEIVKDKVA